MRRRRRRTGARARPRAATYLAPRPPRRLGESELHRHPGSELAIGFATSTSTGYTSRSRSVPLDVPRRELGARGDGSDRAAEGLPGNASANTSLGRARPRHSHLGVREVKATFYLPNAEVAVARPGAPAEVFADAFPGETFRGTIRTVAARAEFTPRNIQTRTDRDRLVYPVEVALANPDCKLRPGMPVTVQLPGTSR